VDENDFEQLYADHWREVLGYALRRTGSSSDAADVASEVFLVIWRRRDQVPGRDDFRPWMYGVARNVLLNHRRGERRRERLGALLLSAVEEQHPDTADVVADSQQNQALVDAVQDLPEPDRELVMLVSWEGLSPTEAAVALQMKPVTARVRLHRARKRLRSVLQEQESLEEQKRERRAGHVPVDGRTPVPAKEVT
jgi:RNA polymerase sigma factor (sigma-70 family)